MQELLYINHMQMYIIFYNVNVLLHKKNDFFTYQYEFVSGFCNFYVISLSYMSLIIVAVY